MPKITSVTRVFGAMHFPQFLDLKTCKAFELLPDGIIRVTMEDDTSTLLREWVSATEEPLRAKAPPPEPVAAKPAPTNPAKKR